jgi:hypothetical protein
VAGNTEALRLQVVITAAPIREGRRRTIMGDRFPYKWLSKLRIFWASPER